jgi:hypothetical protein
MLRAMAVVGAIAFLACAGPSKQVPRDATKAPESDSVKAAAEQDKKDQQKMICSLERPTGSNIAERVCRTPDEIEREHDAAQEKMRELTRPGARIGD